MKENGFNNMKNRRRKVKLIVVQHGEHSLTLRRTSVQRQVLCSTELMPGAYKVGNTYITTVVARYTWTFKLHLITDRMSCTFSYPSTKATSTDNAYNVYTLYALLEQHELNLFPKTENESNQMQAEQWLFTAQPAFGYFHFQFLEKGQLMLYN